MKVRKLYQYLGGDVQIASFIVAVNTLTAVQNFSDFGLSHIGILSEISYSGIHINIIIVYSDF